MSKILVIAIAAGCVSVFGLGCQSDGNSGDHDHPVGEHPEGEHPDGEHPE